MGEIDQDVGDLSIVDREINAGDYVGLVLPGCECRCFLVRSALGKRIYRAASNLRVGDGVSVE